MICPWCQKEMQSGELIVGGQYSAWKIPLWKADSEKYNVLDRMLHMDGKEVGGMTVSGMNRARLEANHCPVCKKFVLEGSVD